MITLTDYTSYAEIRAILGVSIYELADETLALPLFTQVLHTRLRSTAGTFQGTTGSLTALFEELSGVLDPTEAQEDFIILIKQYASYVVAETCLTGLSLFAPKQVADGKSSETRFSSEATFKDVATSIRQELSRLSGKIAEQLGSTDPIIKKMERVRPFQDVVTGELT